MRLLRNLTVILTLTGIWLPGVVGAVEWSLEACIDTAMAKSGRLQSGGIAIERAYAERSEVESERKGSVDFSMTAAHISEVMEMKLSLPLPPGSPPPIIKFGDGNSVDMQVIGRVPLYTGGALKSRRETQLWNAQAVRQQASIDSLDVRYQVETVYWMTAGAINKLEVLKQSKLRLERHRNDLDTLFTLGTGTREMLVAVESKILQVDALLQLAEAEVDAAKLNLGFVTGKAGKSITPLNYDLHPGPRKQERESNSSETPEIKVIDFRLKQAEAASGIVKASYLPSVGLVVAYHYAKPGINSVENDWMSYYNAGLNLNWTIWDWNARNVRTTKARLFERELSVRKAEIFDALTNRMALAERRYRGAESAVVISTERVAKERERLAMVQSRLNSGAGTLTEVLDVEDDLTIAETELIDLKIKLRQASAELHRTEATGASL